MRIDKLIMMMEIFFLNKSECSGIHGNTENIDYSNVKNMLHKQQIIFYKDKLVTMIKK